MTDKTPAMTELPEPERFTKKPVTIEAMQFRNDGSSYALIQWINEGQHAAGRRFASWQNHEIIVPTLEGEHIATPGDWIIKGVKGEFYPCKPDIFEMTYDRTALQAQPAAAGVSDAEWWHGVLGSAGPDLLNLAKQWSDNDVHVYQFANEAEKIVKAAAQRAILALRPQAVPMSEDKFVACLVKANCIGVVKMSYDSGPYYVTRPSINASKLKEAIEAHHGIGITQRADGGEVE